MSWASLANNQTVSFNNLQNAVNTGVFVPTPTPIPISTEQITKADAPLYAQIDQTVASYAAKASNQLVVKQDLVSIPVSTLQWDFTEIGAASGSMEIFVNGNTIANPFTTSNGTYTVAVGDTINIAVTCDTCGSPNDYSNAYSISNKAILSDAACVQNGTASIFTANYTVVSGDVGNQINVSGYAQCASGCL